MASEVVFVAQAQGRIVQPHPQKACVAIESPLWALLEWVTALRIVFARTDSRSAERFGGTLQDRAKTYVLGLRFIVTASLGRRLVHECCSLAMPDNYGDVSN